MCVMLEDGRSVVCVAFAAAGIGTSTFVVRLVAMEEAVRCSVLR